MYVFFFFNDTATTEIYTLSLHDALPISNDLKKKKKFFSKKRIKKKSRDTFESSLSHESVQNSGNVNDKISGMSELDFAPADMDIMQYASTEENDASARSETPFMY